MIPVREGDVNPTDVVPRVDIAELFATHRLGLVRIAVLLVDDLASAEDVVQDAFVGLHRNQEKLRDPQAALAYLQAAVVNGSRSALRRRQTVRKHEHVFRLVDEQPPETELLLAEEHRHVLAAVRTLPPGQQEVLVLRYWADLSEAQIAAALGISRGAVKSQASRAIDKLEAILDGAR